MFSNLSIMNNFLFYSFNIQLFYGIFNLLRIPLFIKKEKFTIQLFLLQFYNFLFFENLTNLKMM